MRPDEQRAALDRFVDVDVAAEALSTAARRLARGPPRSGRPQPAGARAGAGSRPAEVRPQRDRHRRTANPARTTRWSTTSAGCRNSTRCARLRRRRAPRCPAWTTTNRCQRCGVGRPTASGTRSRRWRAPTTRRCGRWARRLADALAVIGDVSTELGDYLAELPSDASTLETKLARQGELAHADPQVRRRHRRCAGNGPRESRERLAQLDVSEEALADLERRVDELAGQGRQRRSRTHQSADQGRQGPGESGDRRTGRPGDGRCRVHVSRSPPCRPARTTPRRSRCRRV